MEITFRTKRVQNDCSTLSRAKRRWGTQRGELVVRRLAELRASRTLAIVQKLPQARCHQLGQNRKGQFAIDLGHPFRLIFRPTNDPLPQTDDGSIDLARVTAIQILEVVDYHG